MKENGFVIRDGVLVKYIGTDTVVHIPKEVREIGEAVFAHMRIREVYLPNGLEVIGARAFFGCRELTRLELPCTLLSIGKSAFAECLGLTVVYAIFSPILTIGDRAFMHCDALESALLPDCITDIGAFAFAYCKSLRGIAIPSALRRLGENAFALCESIRDIAIPSGVDRIPVCAFFKCRKLQKIELCDGLRTLGASCFAYCDSLEIVDIPETVTTFETGVFNGCANIVSINIPNGVTVIPPYTFNSCFFGHIEIPESVREIGDKAFEYCLYLKNIILPSSLRVIGKRAFASCESLDISRAVGSLEEIGVGAFDECDLGFSFTVPDKMSGIGKIFGECPPTLIYAPNLPINSICPKYRKEALYGLCSAIAKGVCPEEDIVKGYIAYARRVKKHIYDTASGMPFVVAFLVKHRILPLEDIDYLINRCGQLAETTALLLGYKAELAGNDDSDPFALDLDELREPTVTEMKKEYSFKIKEDGTLAITSYKGSSVRITVPSHIGQRRVSEISRFAFSPRRKRSGDSIRETARLIEEVTLCDGIEEIGESAFMGCESLTRVVIPVTVRKIANHVFCECTSLRDIDFKSSDKSPRYTELGGSAFLGCNSLSEISLPEGCFLSGEGVFWSCRALESVALPKSTEHIPDYSFGLCPMLREIIFLSPNANADDDAFFDVASSVTVKLTRGSPLSQWAREMLTDKAIEYLD